MREGVHRHRIRDEVEAHSSIADACGKSGGAYPQLGLWAGKNPRMS